MQRVAALGAQPTKAELYRRYCKKADIIHHFAENLAQTLGVFHGLNETGRALKIEGEASGALGTVLFDQMQIMVVRLCALCGAGSRNDDASLGELVQALSDVDFQQFLIEKEENWRRAAGVRALPFRDVAKQTGVLKSRWSALQRDQDALSRIRHYRNKVLTHATTGLDPNRKFLVRDVWRLSRLALSVAKHIRLILEREEWDYLAHCGDGKACGSALVRALHRDEKARDYRVTRRW